MMTYGIPEPGSYFRVPDDDYPDPPVCEDCKGEIEPEEMADPDQHHGKTLCGGCAEEWRGNR